MPRLFIAIDIPAAIRKTIAPICYGVPGAKWAGVEELDPQPMHLTLRFAGEVDGTLAIEIADALSLIESTPFELTLKGVGHAPPRGEPRVLWIGVEEQPILLQLQRKIEKTLVELGLPPEKRNFQPHVTVARLNNTPHEWVANFLAQNALLRTPTFTVEEYHLVSSQLSSKGAVHTKEYSYPLIDKSNLSFREKWQKGLI